MLVKYPQSARSVLGPRMDEPSVVNVPSVPNALTFPPQLVLVRSPALQERIIKTELSQASWQFASSVHQVIRALAHQVLLLPVKLATPRLELALLDHVLFAQRTARVPSRTKILTPAQLATSQPQDRPPVRLQTLQAHAHLANSPTPMPTTVQTAQLGSSARLYSPHPFPASKVTTLAQAILSTARDAQLAQNAQPSTLLRYVPPAITPRPAVSTATQFPQV